MLPASDWHATMPRPEQPGSGFDQHEIHILTLLFICYFVILLLCTIFDFVIFNVFILVALLISRICLLLCGSCFV